MDPIDQIDPTTHSSPLDPLTRVGEAHETYGTATTGPRAVPGRVTRSRRRVSGPVALFGAVLLSAVLGSAGTFGLLAASGTLPAASTAVAPSAASIVQAVASAAPATTDGSVIETVAAAVSPAVVTITTVGVARGDSGVGSGVIVDARGWILTNNHVAADSGSMTVTLADGRTFDGTVAATDATHDLAIVKVDATGLPTAARRLDEPPGRPARGRDRVAARHVHGLGHQRHRLGTGPVHHDRARIAHRPHPDRRGDQPGQQRRPAPRRSGKVIGIDTAEAGSAQGIGFAIPIETARALIAQAIAA